MKYENGTKSHKNESITFRLDSAILDKLREEASHKDISVNTLVSQITKDHVSWHRNATRAGFISVRRVLVTKLLEKYTDGEVSTIANFVAKTSSKDIFLLLRQEYSMRSALDILDTWIKMSGYHYSHNRSMDHPGDIAVTHSFVVQHDMGQKWSLYLSELFKSLVWEFGISDFQYDMTPNTLAFRVRVEDDTSSRRVVGKGSQDATHGSRPGHRNALT